MRVVTRSEFDFLESFVQNIELHVWLVTKVSFFKRRFIIKLALLKLMDFVYEIIHMIGRGRYSHEQGGFPCKFLCFLVFCSFFVLTRLEEPNLCVSSLH